ncbi:MAG: FtsQ-type POTRA domain-containing protein [Alphaproteobacteria bacterium]|nr:FtsQ-type POTRA domain-containing protein [Alphaproteobacteria bacterium]
MSAVKSYRCTNVKRQKVQRTSLQLVGVRRLSSIVTIMGLCAFGLWAYFHGLTVATGLTKSLDEGFACLGFKLEDVVVEGRIRTDKSQILEILQLERGKPLFSINLIEAKEKLENISWVKAARVERRLPDTIFIRISEREPVALWQNQNKTFLVDRDGELVETREAPKYKELLLVTGHQAPRHVGELLALLEQFPELKSRVTDATHLRATRWDITLDGKVSVRLPEKQVDRALAYLLDLEKHHQLIGGEVVNIDMRLPDQLILRLTPEVKKKDSGKDA